MRKGAKYIDQHRRRRLAIARFSIGTNPEQLFAAAWPACFESSIAIAAHSRKILWTAIDAEVDPHLADGAYFISTGCNVSLPGLDSDIDGLVRPLQPA